MAVAVIVTHWTGGPSAPGLTQLCVEHDGVADLGVALGAVRSFWNTCAGSIPVGYTLSVDQTVEKFDEATGALVGEFTNGTPIATVAGAAAGSYAAGVGGRIDWKTSAIRNRRRVTGRTFVVPLNVGFFSSDGTLETVPRDTILNAASGLLTSLGSNGTPLQVWSRPSLKWPVGEANPVVAATMPDKPAVLRGRRDA